VTNLWINPKTIYKKIQVDDEKWIVSAECARKLEFLDKKVTILGEIAGDELKGRSVKLPHRDGTILILPANFVESGTGTGIVMSVPGHAPYDWQALYDLKKEISNATGKKIPIEVISIIQTKEFGEIPAKEICEKFGIQNQNDAKLEDATKELYQTEFYEGILKENTGQFAGKKVSEVKDSIKKWLIDKKVGDILHELNDAPVRCRCGAECVVKILTNQWFLDYGNKEWKEKARKCLGNMTILPNEIKSEFDYVVGWLHERACARQHGLGTPLPWDKDWLVESLSDSVIYMAYYIISKYVNSGKINPENLNDAFF